MNVLHKKRPALIPIFDNEATFQCLHEPDLAKPSMDSPCSLIRIREALHGIWLDLARPENKDVWPALCRSRPARRFA